MTLTCNAPRPSRFRVAKAVADASRATGIPIADIRSDSRRRPVVAARWLAWRELCQFDGFGLAPVARVYGCDHTSILNARDQGWAPPGYAILPRLRPADEIDELFLVASPEVLAKLRALPQIQFVARRDEAQRRSA